MINKCDRLFSISAKLSTIGDTGVIDIYLCVTSPHWTCCSADIELPDKAIIGIDPWILGIRGAKFKFKLKFQIKFKQICARISQSCFHSYYLQLCYTLHGFQTYAQKLKPTRSIKYKAASIIFYMYIIKILLLLFNLDEQSEACDSFACIDFRKRNETR